MSGKLFAQILALIAVAGLIFFAASRLLDQKRMDDTRELVAPSSGMSLSDEQLMMNDATPLNEIDGAR